MKTLLAGVLAICVLGGLTLLSQTRLDLSRHGQRPLFGQSAETQPMQIGATLPSTCIVGDLFFLTSAASGANIYGCVAANVWAPQAGGGGGTLSVSNSGSGVGSRSTLDFFAGFGLLNILSDTGTEITVQPSVDSSVIETRGDLQSGSTLRCASAGTAGTQYTCAMQPTLTTYSNGMLLDWTPDVTSPGGPITLNVDTLGGVRVKLADGIADPVAGDLIGAQMYPIWYDGSVFRVALITPLRLTMGSASAQPACGTGQRGRFWQIPGASGVKDQVAVCAKDATDAYAWRALY